jgi:hypothetical protein
MYLFICIAAGTPGTPDPSTISLYHSKIKSGKFICFFLLLKELLLVAFSHVGTQRDPRTISPSAANSQANTIFFENLTLGRLRTVILT